MLSFGTKINIILFLISLLVALYLFVMQKEMKMMQADINELRGKVKEMQKASKMQPVIVFNDEEEEEEEEVEAMCENTIEDADDTDVTPSCNATQKAQDIDVDQVIKTSVPELSEEKDEEQKDDDHIIKISAVKPKRSRKSKE